METGSMTDAIAKLLRCPKCREEMKASNVKREKRG